MAEGSRRFSAILRTAAFFAVAVAAFGSLSFMFTAGSRQRSMLLMALFTGWVVSPFVALGWAARISVRWPPFASAAICLGILALTVLSLLMYSGTLPMPTGSRPAAVFLLVPLASWVLIAIGGWVSLKSFRGTRG